MGYLLEYVRRKTPVDWVSTLANRTLTASEDWMKARQRGTQNVREFAAYLQTMNDLLTYKYTEEQQIQRFLSKIDPKVSRSVITIVPQPATFDEG
jgi:hypothetical protein